MIPPKQVEDFENYKSKIFHDYFKCIFDNKHSLKPKLLTRRTSRKHYYLSLQCTYCQHVYWWRSIEQELYLILKSRIY